MAADDARKQAEPSFEDELANLERVVGLLERGELGLEEAIREYEQGHQSLKRCREILERGWRRIEILTRREEPSDPAAPPALAPEEAEGRDAGGGETGEEASARWRPFEFPAALHRERPTPGADPTAGNQCGTNSGGSDTEE